MKTSSIRTLALAAAIAASFGVAGIAAAENNMPGTGMQGHMMGGMQGDKMGGMQVLSPEQQETARKVNEKFFSDTPALRKELTGKQAELTAQLYSTTPDSTKIEGLSKEVGALQGKLMAARAKGNADLVKAGIPAMGQGMMGGMGMGGMGMGGMGMDCKMMQGMGGMKHGNGNNENDQPAGEQHNQPGHRQ